MLAPSWIVPAPPIPLAVTLPPLISRVAPAAIVAEGKKAAGPTLNSPSSTRTVLVEELPAHVPRKSTVPAPFFDRVKLPEPVTIPFNCKVVPAAVSMVEGRVELMVMPRFPPSPTKAVVARVPPSRVRKLAVTVAGIGPRVLTLLIERTPAETVTPPVWVLVPERTRVPVPDLMRRPVPAVTPP